MFTDIADALPKNIKPILFDYNQFDEASNALTVASLTSQAEKLSQVLAETRRENPGITIDLVCHSQGCVAAGILKPAGIRKFILVGPPAVLNIERMMQVFDRPGASIHIDGTSTLPRRDGSTTIVPKEYWESIEDVDPIALFNYLRGVAQVIAIHADQDEIIGSKDFSRLAQGIRNIHIDANHDFTDESRPKLIQAVLNTMRFIPIVNEQDEIIGYKLRSQVKKGEIYRVSALWVKNSKGDILLAQRGLNEPNSPGIWGPAVAGTVEQDETYQNSIVKEAAEEIGVTRVDFTPGPKRRHSEKFDYFTQWYTAVIDKPAADFVTQKEELEQVRWFTRKELTKELREHPDQYLNLSWALEEL